MTDPIDKTSPVDSGAAGLPDDTAAPIEEQAPPTGMADVPQDGLGAVDEGAASSPGDVSGDIAAIDPVADELQAAPAGPADLPATDAGTAPAVEDAPGQSVTAPAAAAAAAAPAPSPAPRPMTPVRSLQYAVDIVFCIDVTGSMNPVLDAVKANALRFYDDVQTNLTEKGKQVDQLRVRVVAFRDFTADAGNARLLRPVRQLPRRRGRRGRARIRAGGGGAGDQLAVDHRRRPAAPGHRGVDRSARSSAEPRGPAARAGRLHPGRLQRPHRPLGGRPGAARAQ
jgi:hypothetical protein